MAIARVTSKAAQDLIDIATFVAEHDVMAADRLLDRFDAKCRLLAQQPELGTLREDLAAGLRFFPVGNYLIFYRAIPDGIEIIRVLHGARDLHTQFE